MYVWERGSNYRYRYRYTLPIFLYRYRVCVCNMDVISIFVSPWQQDLEFVANRTTFFRFQRTLKLE